MKPKTSRLLIILILLSLAIHFGLGWLIYDEEFLLFRNDQKIAQQEKKNQKNLPLVFVSVKNPSTQKPKKAQAASTQNQVTQKPTIARQPKVAPPQKKPAPKPTPKIDSKNQTPKTTSQKENPKRKTSSNKPSKPQNQKNKESSTALNLGEKKLGPKTDGLKQKTSNKKSLKDRFESLPSQSSQYRPPLKGGSAQSPLIANRWFDDVTIGDTTYLNLVKHPHIAYFAELRRKVSLAFNARKASRDVPRNFNQAYVACVIGVTIDARGHLKNVRVLKASFAKSLVSEAIQSFQKSAPFRSPPKDILHPQKKELNIAVTYYLLR